MSQAHLWVLAHGPLHPSTHQGENTNYARAKSHARLGKEPVDVSHYWPGKPARPMAQPKSSPTTPLTLVPRAEEARGVRGHRREEEQGDADHVGPVGGQVRRRRGRRGGHGLAAEELHGHVGHALALL